MHYHIAWGSGQCNSYNTLPACLGAVCSGTPAPHCLTARGQWNSYNARAPQLPGRRSLPKERNSCSALPHGLGHWAMLCWWARALQEFHYPLPPSGVAVHCRSCTAHCPEAMR